jgi:hypothetical protein
MILGDANEHRQTERESVQHARLGPAAPQLREPMECCDGPRSLGRAAARDRARTAGAGRAAWRVRLTSAA